MSNLALIWFLQEGGLALSTSMCAILQVAILLYILNGKLGLKGMGAVAGSCGKTLVATSIMALICLGTLHMAPQAGGTFGAKAVRLFLPVASGLIGFLGTAYLLGSEELGQLYHAFRSKKGQS